MAAKKTIAIAGATGKAGTVISEKLAAANNRVLLLSPGKNKLNLLGDRIKSTSPQADVELIECAKDACWEADIIILAIPPSAENALVQKIKQVATQKIVVRLLPVQNVAEFTSTHINGLQQLLPYSKIVTAFINTAEINEAAVTGSDEEAVGAVMDIAIKAGFRMAIAAEF